MTRPFRFLVRMTIFLAAVAVVVAVLSSGLQKAFSHNVGLNALIVRRPVGRHRLQFPPRLSC